MDIQNKVIIITGASGGIGAAAAKLLGAHGAQVVLAARSVDQLNAVAESIRDAGGMALVIPTDMRDQHAIRALVEQTVQHFGRIDVLINNAGQALVGTVELLNLDDFRQVIELNVFGALYAMQAVIPYMRAAGGGLIVNNSSVVTQMVIPTYVGYVSTKHMLSAISKTARAELADENIRIILVNPRRTVTGLGTNAIPYRPTTTDQPASLPAHFVPGEFVRVMLPERDEPDFVAAKILEAIQNEPAEQFMI